MKKLLLTIFISLIWIGSASSQERETEWEGKCFIQFDGKVLVDDEICKMGSDDMPIAKKDEFLVVVTKYVLCDDGNSERCRRIGHQTGGQCTVEIYFVVLCLWSVVQSVTYCAILVRRPF